MPLLAGYRHGVPHRDIKPQNVLVLPTSYVVADFGVARPIDSGHTSSGEWFSFYHASPEALAADRGLPVAAAELAGAAPLVVGVRVAGLAVPGALIEASAVAAVM